MAKRRSKRAHRPRGGVPTELTTAGIDSEVWSDPDLVLGFCDAYDLSEPAAYILTSPRACRDHAAHQWAVVNGYVNKYALPHWATLFEMDIPAPGRARVRAKVKAGILGKL